MTRGDKGGSSSNILRHKNRRLRAKQYSRAEVLEGIISWASLAIQRFVLQAPCNCLARLAMALLCHCKAIILQADLGFSDMPPIVEVARCNVVQTPTSIQRLLPPKSISILQLLCFDLLSVVDDELAMDIDHEIYSDTEPTSDSDIAEILAFLALPNRRMLNQIVDTFGQAWFDGKKSISVGFNPEVVYPFWVLTYWGTMLDACKARDRRVVAQSWLGRTGKTEEEKAMKQTVLGLWSAAPWGGSLRDLVQNLLKDMGVGYGSKFWNEINIYWDNYKTCAMSHP
ncbi:hypothetical protein C8J57DRAFT_1630530 [Mycena rebaudengoi]|nr:hypothetical protein C8J57DRAFT_1630530 [Mycena rebaudengoi]